MGVGSESEGKAKMSHKDKSIAVNGDIGQAEGLLGAKKTLSGKKGE